MIVVTVVVVVVVVLGAGLVVVKYQRHGRRLLAERDGLLAGRDELLAENRQQAARHDAAIRALESEVDSLRRRITADAEMTARRVSALWQLLRVRVEREWGEIAGVGTALPVAWDGSIAAAVAVELESIRENIGTPGQLTMAGPDDLPAGSLGAVATVLLAGELLRALARVGEELQVQLSPDGLQVLVSAGPSAMDATADRAVLAHLADVAASADMELLVTPDGDGLRALLVLSAAAG